MGTDKNSLREYDKIGWLFVPVLFLLARQGGKVGYLEMANIVNPTIFHATGTSVKLTRHSVGRYAYVIGMYMNNRSVDGCYYPPLNSLIINVTTGIPGDGNWQFVDRYFDNKYNYDFDRCCLLTGDNLKLRYSEIFADIAGFGDWEYVEREFSGCKYWPSKNIIKMLYDNIYEQAQARN